MSSARAGQGGKAAGYAEAERAVTKLEQEWFAIQQANDWAKLSKMISDDFVIVDSDGSLGNKESMVAGYKEEAPRVLSLKMQVLVAHAVAPNAVIASGLDDITTKGSNGVPAHRYERFMCGRADHAGAAGQEMKVLNDATAGMRCAKKQQHPH